MCIICSLPQGTEMSEQELTSAWYGNDDGAGYMWVDNRDRINIRKYMKFDQFMEKYKKDFEANRHQSPFIVHFRIGTDGHRNISNVHPFVVNKNMAFCHNGILACRPPNTDERSDTRMFNDLILKQLPTGFLKNKGISNFIELYLEEGSFNNKLAFLESDRSVTIFGEHHGVKDNGRWFSNNSYKVVSYRGTSAYDDMYEGYPGYAEAWNHGFIPIGGPKAKVNYFCSFCKSAITDPDKWSYNYEICIMCKKRMENLTEVEDNTIYVASIRKAYLEKQKQKEQVQVNV